MEKIQLGSIDFLDTILADAKAQAESIVGDANGVALQKEAKAKIEMEELANSFASKFEDEKKRLVKNSNNSIEMEKRKFDLALGDQIITDSIQLALKKLEDFALTPEYASVVRRLIVEGIYGIGRTDLILSISQAEEKIVTKEFLNEIATTLSKEVGRSIQLELSPLWLRKQGVMVADREGRVVYDNQFETRLIRYQSEIRKAVYQVISKDVENGN